MVYRKWMKISIIIASMFFAHTVVQSASLKFRDTRVSWPQEWPGCITDMNFNTVIKGLTARTEMTVTVRDSVATIGHDNMEAVMLFGIPPHSVIDSLYLLIDQVMEPGYLKKSWVATMIFENIVKRQRDPALLRKDSLSENYRLQIFPCARKQARTFKITYTTPLAGSGTIPFLYSCPIDIAGASQFPVERINAEIRIDGVGAECVTVDSVSGGLCTVKKLSPTQTLIAVTLKNNTPHKPFTVTMTPPSYAQSGIWVDFSKDKSGELFFTALLNPAKMLTISQARQKKVLFIWNAVTLSQITYDWELNKYFYNFSYRYAGSTVKQDQGQLLDFIRQNLKEGDLFNLICNDGTVRQFKTGFTPYTANAFKALDRYLVDSISQVDKNFGCESPIALLEKGFATTAGADSIIIVLIDKNMHSAIDRFDTAFVKTKSGALNALLPKNSFTAWCLCPGKRNIVTATYESVQTAHPGTFISVSPQSPLNQILAGITPFFVDKLYPANLTFLCPATRFPYEILGYSSDRFALNADFWYIGKIYDAKSLQIILNGVFSGKKYTFNKTFLINDTAPAASNLSDVWGFEKTGHILSKSVVTAADTKEAMDVSLRSRILSPLTALIALEKRIADSLKMADDVAGKYDTLFLTNTGGNVINPTPADGNSGAAYLPEIRISVGHAQVQIVNAPAQLKELSCTATGGIYDMKGRLVCDLSKQLRTGNAILVWNRRHIAAGTYMLKISANNRQIIHCFSLTM